MSFPTRDNRSLRRNIISSAISATLGGLAALTVLLLLHANPSSAIGITFGLFTANLITNIVFPTIAARRRNRAHA